MAELTAKKRSGLRGAAFGLPAQRKYPMPDASHAANAKARAKQQLERGHLSKSQYSTVVSKANRRLREG